MFINVYKQEGGNTMGLDNFRPYYNKLKLKMQ